MLSAAYDAIKAAAPEDQVVFGGVERPRDHGWIDRVLATPGADAVHKFDIAAVHLRLRLRNTVPELAQWLVDWRQLLARHGFRGPIWVTEHGYPADPRFQWDPAYRGTNVGTGEDAQAALLDRTIPLLARAGAGQVFVTLRDNLYGEYLSEGLVHIDQAQPGDPAIRRPAFDVVREVATIWDPVLYLRSGARRAYERGTRVAAANAGIERSRQSRGRCRSGRSGRRPQGSGARPGEGRGGRALAGRLAAPATNPDAHLGRQQRARGRLVQHQLVLHRTPHSIDLGAQLLLDLLRPGARAPACGGASAPSPPRARTPSPRRPGSCPARW